MNKFILLFDSEFFIFLANNSRKGSFAKKLFLVAASLLKRKFIAVCLYILERLFSFLLTLPIPICATIVKIIVTHAEGFPGAYLRALYYSGKLKGFCGNIIMERNVSLKYPQNYCIGRFVLLDIGCKILCDEATIESGCHLAVNALVTGGGCLIMKKYSGLGHNSIIITATDSIEGGYRHSGPMLPQEQRNVLRSTTTIEQDAWPSTNVVIFPGVTIGQGAVIAPGSIVMNDIKPWSVWSPSQIKQYGFREKIIFDDPPYMIAAGSSTHEKPAGKMRLAKLMRALPIEELLLFIKHNAKPLWKGIERCNGLLLKVLHSKKIAVIGGKYRDFRATNNEFQYRLLTSADVDILYEMVSKLDKDYLKYFNPHRFDYKELKYVLESKNYLPFGYFYNQQLVGYFMLRLFANKSAFTARVVRPDFNGKGIGKDMAKIMYRIANELGWGAYGTASEKNIASLKTHNFEIVKKLPNGYILIKYDTKNTDW